LSIFWNAESATGAEIYKASFFSQETLYGQEKEKGREICARDGEWRGFRFHDRLFKTLTEGGERRGERFKKKKKYMGYTPHRNDLEGMGFLNVINTLYTKVLRSKLAGGKGRGGGEKRGRVQKDQKDQKYVQIEQEKSDQGAYYG